jgi:hypothetical protein
MIEVTPREPSRISCLLPLGAALDHSPGIDLTRYLRECYSGTRISVLGGRLVLMNSIFYHITSCFYVIPSCFYVMTELLRRRIHTNIHLSSINNLCLSVVIRQALIICLTATRIPAVQIYEYELYE